MYGMFYCMYSMFLLYVQYVFVVCIVCIVCFIVCIVCFYCMCVCIVCKSRDSSVGVATRYGLDGPGIEFRWGRNFPHPCRPALEPTQSPVQWIPGLSLG